MQAGYNVRWPGRPTNRGHGRDIVAVGLLPATSLSIPVVAGGIGVELGLLEPANYAALVAAGLLSVIVFPRLAVFLLARGAEASAPGVRADGSLSGDDRPRPGP